MLRKLTLLTIISPLSAQLLLPEGSLPEYEGKLNHRLLIERHGNNELKLGKDIYTRVCMNCHGDHQNVGSVPTSLRFAEGEFQHGNDPYTMYQTLTRGWRTMPPQTALTPKEKYAVIHYIRDAYIKTHNPSQLAPITQEYLAGLPKGNDLGPEPIAKHAWTEMNYGNTLISTYEIATPAEQKTPFPAGEQADYLAPDANLAYKGIATRLDTGAGGISKGKLWSIFEHDSLRVAGVWQGEGFIDWKGIHLNGGHVVRPRTIGSPILETNDAPGWANPTTGEFAEGRLKGLDGRPYGPLPASWGKYLGMYQYEGKTVIRYRIGETEILEHHSLSPAGHFTRHLNIGKSAQALTVRLANAGLPVVVSTTPGVEVREDQDYVVSIIPALESPLQVSYTIGAPGASAPTPIDLSTLTRGGAAQWPQTVKTPIKRGSESGAFALDHFPTPASNPWNARLRTSGFDFTADGKEIIVCCWEGDVYRITGFDDPQSEHVTWRRIATGLFQPLGLKIRGQDVFITCRDQIVRLRDLNGDGETDYYESFNSDAQVTNHFHEFAMGLQSDDEGNLYYARSARHARPPLVPHHGTLLMVSADGAKTEIIAHGFRAANGVCRNPDGSFMVTDQEGHWNPMNRINHVAPENLFYGNIWGYGAPKDESDSAMEPPLCWVDKQFDRSPAELLWVDSNKWGDLNGKLLHISYGHGRVQLVPHETIDGKMQGGMVRLPLGDLPTGAMRGRFNPHDQELYLCGMAAWSTSRNDTNGGLYRLRHTGEPVALPAEIRVTKQGVDLTYSAPLDPASVTTEAFKIKTWDYERSANYGSKRFNEAPQTITAATLSADHKTVSLSLADHKTCWQMAIEYKLKRHDGPPVTGTINNTIHTMPK